MIDPELCGGKGGKTLTPNYKKNYQVGFNVFVYDNLPDKRTLDSIDLADDIGKNLIAIGRTPASYYSNKNNGCESCRPIHKKLGVWNENLAVLRNTDMPAVLIEAGNIVDSEDEAKINNNQYREAFSKAIKKAVDQYFASHPATEKK
jgi:N-acetylmuramoyl-L-alanine amidase